MNELLSADDECVLLALARAALQARVLGMAAPDLGCGGALDVRRGAFVTIRRREMLRGCLGRLDPVEGLAQTVRDLAAAVADSDLRFEPVRPDEVGELAIEISVLTPERRISGASEVTIGRHGLAIEKGRRRGVLLPQVASDHGWDVASFLAHVCLKAQLPPDAWRHDACLSVFEAQVFSELPAGSL